MKKFKRLFAVILSLAMVLGMSLTAFADDSVPASKVTHMPTKDDKIPATVTKVEPGATVTAYKVVEANYDTERGFTGYSWVEALLPSERSLFVDVQNEGNEGTVRTLNIDEDEIIRLAGIAKAENSGLQSFPMSPLENDNTTYMAVLPAGSYVVLVTNANEKVYNPMLIGVYYRLNGSGDDNSLITEPLDSTSDWELLAENGYAKSSEPPFEKIIVDSSSGNNHGDDVAIGDTVKFQITTTMPSYSSEYIDPKFNIKDTISKGLDYKESSLKVQTKGADGNLVDIPQENYEQTFDDAVKNKTRDFAVEFKKDYIEGNKGADIIITYEAVLNSDAGLNYDANTNTAKLEYSNNPNPDEGLKEKKDITYHYTFGIDASLNGSAENKTQELYKLDENGTAIVEGETVKVTSPLEGATFELRKKNADGTMDADPNHTYTTSSNENGELSFTGLDAGEYILVETKAPSGYSLDSTEHTVKITAVYDETSEAGKGKGRLLSYTITIDDEATSTYKATYKSTEEVIPTIIDKTELGVTGIKNTKLASLPSTGGIGTTIFTIGGCLIMVVAAALFFASRRKSAK